MGKKEKQEFEDLKSQYELLKRKTEKTKATHLDLGWFQTYATPVKMIFGLILGLVCVFPKAYHCKIALFVVTCIILSTVDRTLHSPCGYKCGYLLTTPQIFNPLDQLLTYASIVRTVH
jgi:LMBR1 domain-containing protein 1